MKTLTHSQYCKNNEARSQMGYMNGLYIFKGKFYTKEQIDALFPIDLPLIDANNRAALKGENACKRGNFIKGQKSY